MFRKVAEKVIENGRRILQNVLHRGEKVGTRANEAPKLKCLREIEIIQKRTPVQLNITRQVFDGIFPRVSIQSFAAAMRRMAALRLIGSGMGNARNVPLFGFVGLAVATNQKWNRNAKQDNVFADIRKMFSAYTMKPSQTIEEDLRLDSLEFGEMIEKGCNAAVYEARQKWPDTETSVSDHFLAGVNLVIADKSDVAVENEEEEMMSVSSDDSDVTVIDSSDIIGIDDSHIVFDASIIDGSDDGMPLMVPGVDMDIVLAEALGDSHFLPDAVMDGDSDVEVVSDDDDQGENTDHVAVAQGRYLTKTPQENKFNLAIKMMFNYDAESNTEAITRAMEKEALPAKMAAMQGEMGMWENGNHVKKKSLLPHPNIVEMLGWFVDIVPNLPGSIQEYPAALPSRINPKGWGRNMTMFLVMKRYTHTLQKYVATTTVGTDTQMAMLAQLLEGVVFLVDQEISHRDLKSDNILIDAPADINDLPILVISDFGCCLAEEKGLKVPYVTGEISKGGNGALMAPEIACATPGRTSVLDYRKSDLWAVGTLTYEICGLENPFYRSSTNPHRLDSRYYREADLPNLPESVPRVIQKLASSLLRRNPQKRPLPEVAANVLQLYLWGPRKWFSGDGSLNMKGVQEWLMTFVIEVMCYMIYGNQSKFCVEWQLKVTFLSRLDYRGLQAAVDFIQTI